MNTKDVRDHLRLLLPEDVFLNVYAVNELPKKKIQQSEWCLVCNCCPSQRVGEHWIAIYYHKGKLDFFDSFGLSPESYAVDLLRFIAIQTCDVAYNAQKLQSYNSDACGHYCIIFFDVSMARRKYGGNCSKNAADG